MPRLSSVGRSVGWWEMTSDAELDRLEGEWQAAKRARIDHEARLARAHHEAEPDEDDAHLPDPAELSESGRLRGTEEDALDAYRDALRRDRD
jgi:hypothetical protein